MRTIALLFLAACSSDNNTTSDAGDAATTDAALDTSTKDAAGDATDATSDAVDSAVDVASEADAPFDAGPGTYSAYGLAGGYDHVFIIKTVGNTCFVIALRSPDNNGGGLMLPAMWGFQFAEARQPAGACSPNFMGMITNQYAATSQSGTITWNGSGIPTTVSSVMATLTFNNNPIWCPPSESFSAMNIMVQ